MNTEKKIRIGPSLVLVLSLALLAGCRSGDRLGPRSGVEGVERGVASWYGGKFHGRRTANGETYDKHAMTAAHKTLAFGTVVEVVNLDNGRSARLRINDRGPFVKGRILDVSYSGAKALDMVGPGTARIELRIVSSPEDGILTVQVGAFRERRRAEALSLDLQRDFSGVAVSHDGTWYRVRVGEYERRADAEEVRRRLRRLGFQALVVSAD